MSDDFTKALLREEAAPRRALADALFATVKTGVPFVHALAAAEVLGFEVLERYLGRSDVPFVREVVPDATLIAQLPPGLCGRLRAIPVRRDKTAVCVDPVDVVDVVVADPTDAHPADEIAFHLGARVRLFRATVGAIEEALEARRSRATPPWGTPIHDAPTLADPEPAPNSLGSEIPIPLTRRAFSTSAVSGGTQRPPPWVDPTDSALGEGYAVEPGAFRQIVEVNERRHDAVFARAAITQRPALGPSFIPSPPSVPTEMAPSSHAGLARSPEVAAVVDALREAASRDAMLDLILTGARVVAVKAALFVVKRDGYHGWTCTPEFSDEATLRALHLPFDVGSVFDQAVRDGFYLGPIPPDDAHGSFGALLRGGSDNVALAPIFVSGKAIVVLVADDLTETGSAIRALEELARAAATALMRVVRARR